ncbi:beta strand repeat-containing protein [Aminipila terrae]|uniref:Listeria/Bacterioides repeat-containing protein n=1 Tax=Aminipila terrae TaxID=2697030 RepID=A0A6P1MLI4_9FIRM|nr:carboxypeptidase regulatory-like domain-containing protein [Aminipila terrae]QHI72928.1 hypothetical protein Ami3637_11400 [Aminipila terrae]
MVFNKNIWKIFFIIATVIIASVCIPRYGEITAYASDDITLSVANTNVSGGFGPGYGTELVSGEAGSTSNNPGIEVYFRDKQTEKKAGVVNTIDLGSMTANASIGYGFFHARPGEITTNYADFSTIFTKDLIIHKTDDSNFSLKEIKFFQEGGPMDLVVEGYLNGIKQGEKVYSVDIAANAYVQHPLAENPTAFSNIDEVRVTGKNYNGTSDYDHILDSGFLLFNSITVADPILPKTTHSAIFCVGDADSHNVLGGATVTIGSQSQITSNTDGTATLPGLSDGTYSYTITKSGYETYTGSITITGANATVYPNLTQTAAATYTANFHIVNAGGSPLQGATVTLNGYTQVTTDANGDAAITGVSSGTGIAYTAKAAGYADKTGTIDVSTGNVNTTVQFMAPATYTANFHIVNVGGYPIQGATVTLNGYTQATTDANGDAAITGVSSGTGIAYTAKAAGYADKTGTIDVSTGNVNTTVQFITAATYTANFHIVNEGGYPIQGATVTLNGYTQVTTDANGDAAINGVSAGTGIAYTAKAAGYADKTGTIDVSTGNVNTTVQFITPATYTANFHIVNAGGFPIQGATVTLNGYTQVTTDANGDAAIMGVSAGTGIAYTAKAAGYADKTGTIDVGTGNVNTTVQFITAATYTANFHIVNEGGYPIQGATVTLNGYTQVTTDANGDAAITGVSAGTGIAYTAKAAGYADKTGTIDVSTGNVNTTVQFTTAATYTANFHIVNVGGSPIQGATVTLNGYTQVTTDANGDAAITGVSSGTGIAYTAKAAGYADKTGTIDVSTGNVNTTVQFITAATYTANFHIVNEGGYPIQGATVTLNGYTQVTTDANGDAAITGVSVGTGIAYTAKAAGYADKTGTIDVSTGNVNTTVQFITAVYTVTYMNNYKDTDTSVNTTQAAIGTSKIAAPVPPVRSGYTFGGWYTEKTCTTGWNFKNNTVIGNMTLFAKWSTNPLPTYTVSYNSNGATSGSVPADNNNYTSGSSIQVKGNVGSLAKAGYTFGGWELNGKTYNPGQSFNMSGDITLSAVWTPVPITYTVTYKDNHDGAEII